MSKIARSHSEMEADLAYQAKMLERVRDGLLFIDELEDEGDRVFFASTNHADHFRDLREDISTWDFERAVWPASGRDLYEEMRQLRDAIRTMRSALEGARGALQMDVDRGNDEDDPEWVRIATVKYTAAEAAIALSNDPALGI